MAGRPKMTDAEKAKAKAAREAAKATAGAKGKADKAEARAAGSAKAATEAKPKATAKPQSSANTDDLDFEEKQLFLNHHLPNIRRLRELYNTANSNLRNAYKAAKAEAGFTKADFDTAFAVETAENEARERAKIARQLKIAKIMGSSLGAQLNMFLEPDRTPAADIAFQEGETDAMQNKAARPKYDPSTEQHRKYLEGFHSVSEMRVKAGIKPTDDHPEVKADQEAKDAAKAKTKAQQEADAKAFAAAEEGKKAADPTPASSGTPLTRSEFIRQQQAKKEAETTH